MHAAERLVPRADICLVHDSQVGADVPNALPGWWPGRPGGRRAFYCCGVGMVTLALLNKADVASHPPTHT